MCSRTVCWSLNPPPPGSGRGHAGPSPEQHVAGVAGRDPVEGVHVELMVVARTVLRVDVGSAQDNRTTTTTSTDYKLNTGL